MPDIRYHFLYLIAVFLMLGVGMLVGASFVGPDQIKRQTTYIRDLKAQANEAVQQGQATQDQVAKTEAALSFLRPGLVRGKLAGRRITLIQTGGYADATQAAATALRDAGATTVVTVALGPQWGSLRDTPRSAALTSLARVLTAGTVGGTGAQALQDLESQGLVTLAGSLDAPCTLFVLVGGAKNEDGADDVGALDGALIGEIKDASPGSTVVGCEPLGAAVSFIPTYQSASVATVDCVDQPLGQMALPFALRGGAAGDDYGLKPTAKRTLPAALGGAQ